MNKNLNDPFEAHIFVVQKATAPLLIQLHEMLKMHSVSAGERRKRNAVTQRQRVIYPTLTRLFCDMYVRARIYAKQRIVEIF